MASTISAGITTTTALSYSADTSGVLQLQTNGTTTAVTIDTNQNVGIGTSSPAARLDLLGTATGTSNNFRLTSFSFQNAFMLLNMPNNGNYTSFEFQEAGSTQGSLRRYGSAYGSGLSSAIQLANGSNTLTFDSSGNLLVGTTSALEKLTVNGRASFAGYIYPATDNAFSCGLGGNRWSVVYAATGTINTSDAREKTPVRNLTNTEITAAQQLATEIGAYKWLSAVAEKGENAREHIGMTVQRAIEIMEANGLSPFNYGFICYDENKEMNRYSFRMDELTMFISRGQQAMITTLQSQVTTLQTQVTALKG